MAGARSLPTFGLLSVATVASLVVGIAVLSPGSAAAAAVSDSAAARSFATTRHGIRCTGPATAHARALAVRVQDLVGPALARVGPRVAVAVADSATGVRCSARSTRRYDSASIVKAAIVAALLLERRSAHRSLSTTERALARAAITRSDNGAASKLWRRVGGTAGIRRFFARAGMSRTIPGPGGYWGLTQVTAGDELILLRVITERGLLAARDRAYLQGLMASVVPSQRWGVPVGAPPKGDVGNKNGWLPRRTKGWRVHSIGFVRMPATTYDVVLLSDGNATMAAGVRRLDVVARAVHAALGIARSGVAGTQDARLGTSAGTAAESSVVGMLGAAG
jgi:beta-lactamase class A